MGMTTGPLAASVKLEPRPAGWTSTAAMKAATLGAAKQAYVVPLVGNLIPPRPGRGA
jgi:hypothetical protein